MNRAELERLAALWRRQDGFRAIGFGTAVGLLAAGLFARSSVVMAGLVGGVAAAVVGALWQRRARVVTAETVAEHLNRECAALEESAALWLREPEQLSTMERLQLRRLDAAWEQVPSATRALLGQPKAGKLWPAMVAVSSAAVILLAVVFWPAAPQPASAPVASAPAARPAAGPGPSLRSAALAIDPPAYTGLPPRRVTGLDAEVPENSIVTWELEFAGDVAGVVLSGSGRDAELELQIIGGGRFRGRAPVAETRLYQVAVVDAAGRRTTWPEMHALKIKRDEPPRLLWREPLQSRTIVDPALGRPLLRAKVGVTDDYGVADVALVMTVAKGSGEGVKFREQQIELPRISGAVTAEGEHGRELDLLALGLEPGDELYFYAVARDRRTPTPNQVRSETRFVVLRGPESTLTDPGLAIAGVNRVPQFFRSQRQLILDTERLLAEQATLSEEKFRARSEDIGVDQKLLRLRYGQFLGEEFEASGEGAPREAQAMARVGAVRGQSREEAVRSTAVDRAVEALHTHTPPAYTDGRPPTVEELMASSLHQHDSPEAATLFDSQVKASLRAVLGAMWEAEGFLRTAQPAKALPAENRALEFLKALQQADRVYVRRIGYEPAPLKEAERRLRGELGAIPLRSQDKVPVPEADPTAGALRSALASATDEPLASVAAETAALVETRLLRAAQENPDAFLAAVGVWKRRVAGLTRSDQEILRRALWTLLPPSDEAPQRAKENAPTLHRRYQEALDGRSGGGR